MSAEKEAFELVEGILNHRKTNKLLHYRPYEYQKRFHALHDSTGVLAQVRVLQASNQCFSPWSPMETDRGERLVSEMLGEAGFGVRSWDGERRCTGRAGRVWMKGIEPAFLVLLDSGQAFQSTGRHRVLTSSGWLSLDRLVRTSDGLRLRRTGTGSPASCDVDGYPRDSRPLLDQGSVLESPPSAGGVHTHSQHHEILDAAGTRSGRSHACQGFGHPPISGDAPDRIADLCAQFSDPSRKLYGVWPISTLRDVQRCLRESGRLPEGYEPALCLSDEAPFWGFGRPSVSGAGTASCGQPRNGLRELSDSWFQHEAGLPQSSDQVWVPLNTPEFIGGAKILAVLHAGYQPILDFEVFGTHCYEASGVIHHNSGKTFSGAMETAMHATGMYPDWWQGHRLSKAPDILVGSSTNETGRDICQKELFGEPDDPEQLGTGAIPKSCIGETVRKPGVPNAYSSVLVRHVSGSWSKVSFRAYEQGPQKHMGLRIDFGWLDEEPPWEIYSQYIRATLSTNGKLILTYTPEKGVTQVVYHFMNDIQPGEALMGATWEDADHFKDPAVREQKLRLISSDEREMRSKGIPMMGSGLVFPVSESDILIDPIEIPSHWPRIVGIDFGYDHPFAASWLAWDRDSDIVYLYDCYRESKQTPPIHSAAIKARGDWIPVVWPHDGMVHDKGSGIPLADQYRNLGLNMTREKFSNPYSPGQVEGQGGQGVEVGIIEMLTRMQTGRFRVFRTCREFIEEIRIYHRDNGKLVKLFDDTISAARYATQSLRFAQTPVVKIRPQVMVQGVSNW